MKLEELQAGTGRVLPQRNRVPGASSVKRGVRAIKRAGRHILNLRAAVTTGAAEGRTGAAEDVEKREKWIHASAGKHRTVAFINEVFGNLPLGITEPTGDRRPAGRGDTGFQCRGEIRVAHSEEVNRKIVGLIPDIIFRINSAYEFLDVVSPSDEQLYLPREEVLGKRIDEIFPEKEARLFSECIRKAFEKGMLQKIEYPLEVKAGTIHFEARVIPSDDREVMVLARDVTQEKEARLARQKVEKMEGLSILAGGVAHDFNNLLTVILGNANLAMMEARKDSESCSRLEAIESASLEAAGLCKKMLAYAGMNRVELNEINVNDVIGRMHELLRRSVAEEIALRVQFGNNVPTVMSEASQVEQMVMSLVINAVEAVDDKCGEIRIATGRTRIGKEVLENLAFASELTTGEAAFVEVSDNGVGMSPDILERMFDPFFTTKFTGRGLGLSALQGMVAMHKGGCRVVSEPGGGTTVRIFLPAVAQSECAAAEKHVDSHHTLAGEGSILVVDDEAGMRRIANSMLAASGFSVMTAGSGGEAIEKYRRHHAGISAVVLDMAMPDRNGAQVLGELRKIHAGVPVLMMSGYPKPEAADLLSEEEPDGFLKKPFSLEGLMAELRYVLGNRQADVPKNRSEESVELQKNRAL